MSASSCLKTQASLLFTIPASPGEQIEDLSPHLISSGEGGQLKKPFNPFTEDVIFSILISKL